MSPADGIDPRLHGGTMTTNAVAELCERLLAIPEGDPRYPEAQLQAVLLEPIAAAVAEAIAEPVEAPAEAPGRRSER